MKGLVLDQEKFWKLYHKEFGGFGIVTQNTVDGLNYILERFETEARLDNIPQFAYCAATAFHESGKPVKFQGKKAMDHFNPVREGKASSGSSVWKKYQSKYWHTGYYGRGLVQTTHEPNYLKVGKLIGVGDLLVRDPDKLLEPSYSYESMVAGMVHGIYRADKKGRQTLDRYFPREKATHRDYYLAREIINGDMERFRPGAEESIGDEIALIALKFDEIFRACQIEPPDDYYDLPVPNQIIDDVSTANTEEVRASEESNLSESSLSSVELGAFEEEREDRQTSAGSDSSASDKAVGQLPGEEPKSTFTVEDYKPWFQRWMKRIWGWWGAVNVAQAPTFAGLGAATGGDYWWVGIVAAILIFLITLFLVLVASVGLGIVLYRNRKEIKEYFAQWLATENDPRLMNFKMEFEKK